MLAVLLSAALALALRDQPGGAEDLEHSLAVQRAAEGV